ncbi:LysR family transcriptional regulator [Embleya sp. NPDC055664]
MALDRHEIECFLTLAEELHFGRTATRLLVSQANVSQTVRKTERHIGAPLFERTSRSVRLTPLGQRFHDELAPAYREMTAIVERARERARGVTGVLNAGFMGAGLADRLAARAAAYRTANPGADIRLREVHFAAGFAPLRAGEVDVMTTCMPVTEPDLVTGPTVLREPQVLAVAVDHPLARRGTASLEDLADQRVPTMTTSYPDAWVDARLPRNTPAGRAIERGSGAATLQELIALVTSGGYVMPFGAHIRRYYARPDIAYLPLTAAPELDWRLFWARSHETELVRGFAAETT